MGNYRIEFQINYLLAKANDFLKSNPSAHRGAVIAVQQVTELIDFNNDHRLLMSLFLSSREPHRPEHSE
jgi:hypothetical protein